MVILIISIFLTVAFYATLFNRLPATKWVRIPVIFPGAIILVLLFNGVQVIAWRLLVFLLQGGA